MPAHRAGRLRRHRDLGHQGHVRAPRPRPLARAGRRHPARGLGERPGASLDGRGGARRGPPAARPSRRRRRSASRSSTSAPAARASDADDLERQTDADGHAWPTEAAQRGVTLCVQGPRRRVHLQHADHAARDGEDHLARRSASTWTPATSTAPARTRQQALPAVLARVQHIHIRDCKGRGPARRARRPGLRPRRHRPVRLLPGDGRGRLRRPGLPGGHRRGSAGLDLARVCIIAAESYGYLNACLQERSAPATHRKQGERMPRKPNLILFGIDSLRADHMSLYGYPRLTTPHMDKFAAGGTVFEQLLQPAASRPRRATPPCSPAWTASAPTWSRCATRADSAPHVKTLAEVLGEQGYNTTCVGFSGNPAVARLPELPRLRGLGLLGRGPQPQGREPERGHDPRAEAPGRRRTSRSSCSCGTWTRTRPTCRRAPFERMFYDGDEFDPANKSLDPVYRRSSRSATTSPAGSRRAARTRTTSSPSTTARSPTWTPASRTSSRRSSALGLEEDTLVVIDSDHGETLYDHDCYFDHHGLYDCTLHVPLVFRLPGQGARRASASPTTAR